MESGPVMPGLVRAMKSWREGAALVVHRRLSELEVHLADVGVEDDQPAQAHGRGFGHAQQLWHLAGHVLVDMRLAGESPAFRDLLRPELPVIGSFRIGQTMNDAHLALAARPATTARRIDRQAYPVRRAEHRGARGHARGALEGEIGDLELARDHDVVLARSAR